MSTRSIITGSKAELVSAFDAAMHSETDTEITHYLNLNRMETWRLKVWGLGSIVKTPARLKARKKSVSKLKRLAKKYLEVA